MELIDLQKKLKKHKLDAFIVTRNNMFLGQDIREDENIIHQLTGFSGSAGTLLIMPEKNILFVDGRYELQAPQEVNLEVIDVICTKNISFENWIKENLSEKNIGYNPWAHSVKWLKHFSHINLVADTTFIPLQISAEPTKIFEHEIKFCGKSREEKISLITEYLKNNNLNACFLGSADNISWLLNLRSDALPTSPVFRCMALIDENTQVKIFSDNIDASDLPSEINIFPFSELHKHLKKLKNQRLGYVPASTSVGFISFAESYQIKTITMPDICSLAKAIKNEQELICIRNAHIRDGIAVCKFLYWLENNWQEKTELDIVDKLHKFRNKQKNYFSESFDTIAAVGSNGAIVHYSPSDKTNKKLEKGNLLLLDSGAQYFDGTTDITRTIAIDTPTKEMCNDFTLVLKGHISLSKSIFPNKTSGKQLDVLARQFLWQEGKNYNHGTGHGVGCFLNVHEGPHSISTSNTHCGLEKGMITSIEPGFYLTDKYGIRIENLVEICCSKYPEFLCFKNLTLVPIDKKLINKYLLTDEEKEWLDNYHQEVWKKISPHLTPNEKKWLYEACSAL